MKILTFFVFSIIFLFQKNDQIDKTAQLLKQNNLPELFKTIAPKIELGLLNDAKVYTKEQAEPILNNFFSKNTVTAVKVLHKVDSNPEMQYAVVVIVTKAGSFRTSFSVKNNSGVYQLTELTIVEEKGN